MMSAYKRAEELRSSSHFSSSRSPLLLYCAGLPLSHPQRSTLSASRCTNVFCTRIYVFGELLGYIRTSAEPTSASTSSITTYDLASTGPGALESQPIFISVRREWPETLRGSEARGGSERYTCERSDAIGASSFPFVSSGLLRRRSLFRLSRRRGAPRRVAPR